MSERLHRPHVESASRIRTSDGIGFGRIARARRTVFQEMEQARRERGQRDEVEPVVVKHRLEWKRIAAAQEMKIAGRNLEARDVAEASRAEDVSLERDQGTLV